MDVALDPRDPNIALRGELGARAHTRTPQERRPRFGALEDAPTPARRWTEIKGGGFPETCKGPHQHRDLAAAIRTSSIVKSRRPRRRRMASYVPRSAPEGTGLVSLDRRRQDVEVHEHEGHAPVLLLAGSRRSEKSRIASISRRTQIQFSDDGGKTAVPHAQQVHVDYHGMWIDPNDPEHFIIVGRRRRLDHVGSGGNFRRPEPADRPVLRASATTSRCRTTSAAARRTTARGAARAAGRRAAHRTYWFTFSGGDGLYTAQDPTNPNIIYGESQGGNGRG